MVCNRSSKVDLQEILSRLLHGSVNPDILNRQKQTPLMLAAMHGMEELLVWRSSLKLVLMLKSSKSKLDPLLLEKADKQGFTNWGLIEFTNWGLIE
ncbi:RING-type E3 ubiquitin transferase [Trifolium repens]|nr:RING-type E3 ubiquitin transferase [Trifolium repens]